MPVKSSLNKTIRPCALVKRSTLARASARRGLPAVIQPLSPRELSLEEAEQLLALVKSLTAPAAKSLAPIQDKIQNMVPADPRLPALSADYERIVRRWQGKLARLGVTVHGLWQVGFDSGEGWWSWQYPETRLKYFQEYDQPFSARQPLNALNRRA